MRSTAAADTRAPSSALDRALVPGIAITAATLGFLSLWMVVDPRSFFDELGPFGAYNPHYIGDAAAFQGGVAIALAASIFVPVLRTGALVAAAAMTGLHAINHWIDVDAANGGSNADVLDAISLTVGFVLILGLVRASLRQAAK